jgi:hypothetical protein
VERKQKVTEEGVSSYDIMNDLRFGFRDQQPCRSKHGRKSWKSGVHDSFLARSFYISRR